MVHQLRQVKIVGILNRRHLAVLEEFDVNDLGLLLVELDQDVFRPYLPVDHARVRDFVQEFADFEDQLRDMLQAIFLLEELEHHLVIY